MTTLYLALFLVLVALVFFWQASAVRRRSGLPGGHVIYTDTRGWGPVEKPLYDAALNLTGKPDYLVEKNNTIIPVEVKSAAVPPAPYDSHIYQVAAYCYLVEHSLGKRPPYGILHYTGRLSSRTRLSTGKSYAIDYTHKLEEALLDLVAEMRSQERSECNRSHDNPARCKGCGYRSICDQKLAG
jgi:CRISPR-associated exonuclease Cas4